MLAGKDTETMLEYAKKYGDLSFSDFSPTEVDMAILAMIAYANLKNTSLTEHPLCLNALAQELFDKIKQKIIKDQRLSEKSALKILKVVYKRARYRDLLFSHFVDINRESMHFSAYTAHLPNHHDVIVFKGTGRMVDSWHEDLNMSVRFPVPAQKEAKKYLRARMHGMQQKISVVGHSKGGNLAVVAAMWAPFWKHKRIRTVYSFDGPGLPEKHFQSRRFLRIKSRLKHLAPEDTVVSGMLKTKRLTIVRSQKTGVMAHDMISWQVQGKNFQRGARSDWSKRFEKQLDDWLEKHPKEDRQRIIDLLFGTLKKMGIEDVLALAKISNLARFAYNLTDASEEEKALLISFVKACFTRRK